MRPSVIEGPVAARQRAEKSCGSNFSLGLIGASFAGAGPSACPPQSVSLFGVDCDAWAKLNAANSNNEAPTTIKRTKQRRICKLLISVGPTGPPTPYCSPALWSKISSPFSLKIFMTTPIGAPALEGPRVIVILVPGFSASVERDLVQPCWLRVKGVGAISPAQCVTLPAASVTSKKTWGCGFL